MVVFFFFSSRRRHTRYWRDWSSDVCSSDLTWRSTSSGRRPRHQDDRVTKLLVVDDEAEIRSLLGAVLQSKGFEVVTAEDGAAALQQVQRERPAVILMDLSMPRM